MLFLSPVSVFAHAYVVSSTPGANETLAERPTSVSIEFSEPIEEAFHTLNVTGPDGERVDAGDSRIDPDRPTRLSAALQQDLPEGVYAVHWKVVSGDGHPVSGTIPFQIGQGGSGAVQHEAVSREGVFPGWSLLAVRWLFYGGMAGYMGAVIFHLVLLPRDSRPAAGRLGRRSRLALLAGYAAAAAGIVLSLPQQTASDAGSSWKMAWDPQLIRETLKYTSFGEVWQDQALLLLVLLGFTLLLLRPDKSAGEQLAGREQRSGEPGRPTGKEAHNPVRHNGDGVPAESGRPRFGQGQRPLLRDLLLGGALLCSLGLLLAKAMIGHAATAPLKSAAVTADFLHLASSLIWLGGVGSLAFLLPASTKTAPAEDAFAHKTVYWRVIRRFSVLAAGCIAVLLATGTYGSLLHVPTWYALTHTDYGRVLLAKILLTLVCLALGLSAFLRGRKPSRPLGAGIWTEFGTGVVILVLAALLANLPTAAANRGPAHLTHRLPDGSRVTVDISPNAMGANSFRAALLGPDGQPRQDVEQFTLELSSKEMDMGKMEITLPGPNPPPVQELITMSGRWKVHVHILFKSLNTWDHDFELKVGG